MNKIKIIATAQMRKGTFEAKFIPLAMVDMVEKIYVLRKSNGPDIPKVQYLILPAISRFKLFSFLIPIFLIKYTIKLKADFILSYHLIPHAFYAFIASHVSQRPFIFCQTGGYSEILSNKYFIGWIIRNVLKSAYFINVPGKQSLEFRAKQIGSAKKIGVLHSTIDTNEFKPDDNISTDIDILFVGSLIERKQVDKIIISFKEIVNQYPNCKLAIVGEGQDKFKLLALSKSLMLENNITFYGFQNNVKSFLLRSKIFIMASKVEGLPVALMEAMACEKLVIAPAVDNIPTVLIDNLTGLLLINSDQKEINNTLLYAYSNYSSLDSLRKNARLKIEEEYSYSIAIKKWENIFNERSIGKN